MWVDPQAVVLEIGRDVLDTDVWLVQSQLPPDWVTRVPLFLVRIVASGSGLDSRFDHIVHTVQADAYATTESAARAALSTFRDGMVAGNAGSTVGRCGVPDVVASPFLFPSEDVPDGVKRVSATFRATFSP
jgi:hypothetical protein